MDQNKTQPARSAGKNMLLSDGVKFAASTTDSFYSGLMGSKTICVASYTLMNVSILSAASILPAILD